MVQVRQRPPVQCIIVGIVASILIAPIAILLEKGRIRHTKKPLRRIKTSNIRYAETFGYAPFFYYNITMTGKM